MGINKWSMFYTREVTSMDNAIDFNQKIALLKKQACFSQFSQEETETLANLLVEKYYTPSQTIVTEGDRVDSVYLIVKGTADVRHIFIKDNALHTESVATLSAGNAIGLNDSGFYSLSGLRTATVVAITDMVLLYLSVAVFHGFALAHSHVSEIMRKNASAILNDIPP